MYRLSYLKKQRFFWLLRAIQPLEVFGIASHCLVHAERAISNSASRLARALHQLAPAHDECTPPAAALVRRCFRRHHTQVRDLCGQLPLVVERNLRVGLRQPPSDSRPRRVQRQLSLRLRQPLDEAEELAEARDKQRPRARGHAGQRASAPTYAKVRLPWRTCGAGWPTSQLDARKGSEPTRGHAQPCVAASLSAASRRNVALAWKGRRIGASPKPSRAD
mmetsp:Transcript_24220/g.71900  ORF Transcript_24220/g.71900 Transcript_24220/m.71900 type:complete len:220 (-) Transcript_24220:37-696(-)